MTDFIKENLFSILLCIMNIILIILYVSNNIKLTKLRKSYKDFMIRLGNGTDIAENLKQYMDKVEDIEKQNLEIVEYARNLDLNMKKCLQKVGVVKYNAFDDVGSDLSFALAILDDKNNGYVLNGIYARDNSNIYAKPVENGKSSYVLSEEEKEAIYKAVNQK